MNHKFIQCSVSTWILKLPEGIDMDSISKDRGSIRWFNKDLNLYELAMPPMGNYSLAILDLRQARGRYKQFMASDFFDSGNQFLELTQEI